MHDRGFGDAGLVHGFQQRLVGRRPLARPRRLLAAERSKRIAFGVRRNDMGMNINDWRHGTSRDAGGILRRSVLGFISACAPRSPFGGFAACLCRLRRSAPAWRQARGDIGIPRGSWYLPDDLPRHGPQPTRPQGGAGMPLIHDKEVWREKLAALPLARYGAGET